LPPETAHTQSLEGMRRRLIMSELIISNPKIMMGKPVIKGTRITVELILEKIAAGESVNQILNEHPRLTREAIQASCAFAADTNSPSHIKNIPSSVSI